MNNFKKVKAVTLLSTQTLEGNEADTQAVADRVIVETYESDQLNLVCKYLVGTGETNNNAYIKVWGYIGQYSADNDFPYGTTTNNNSPTIAADTNNWIQIGTYDTSSGTSTFTASVLKIVGAASATTYDAHFAFGITLPKIRISAYEDGVASNKGRLTVVALIQ